MLTPKEIELLKKLRESPPERSKWCYGTLAKALKTYRSTVKDIVKKFLDEELFNDKDLFEFALLETERKVENGHEIVYIELTDEGEDFLKLMKHGSKGLKLVFNLP